MLEEDTVTSIPISVLREEIANKDKNFKTRSKAECIKKLRQLNPKLLEDLSNYYSSVREKRLFLCKIKNKFSSKFADVPTVTDKLQKLKYKDGDGSVYEVKSVSFVPAHQMIFFKVFVHSDLKKFSKEKPDMDGDYNLSYRDKRTTICLLHLSPLCLEIRAGSRKKVDLALTFLNSKFFEENNGVQIYALSDDEKKTLAGVDGLKYKEAIFQGLSLEGSDEITIIGEDVGRTIDYFKKQGIDLEKKASVSNKKKIESSDQQFRFYEDGKISIKRRIKNAFEVLAGTVFKNEKK